MAAYSQLIESIGRQREAVIGYQSRMTAIPALGPDNGGTGEMPKALYLEGVLRDLGVSDILRVDAPDDRVPDGVRPNIVARIPGKSSRRLWILGHMDVVPAGELSHWKSDPWKTVVDGDRIYGRGVEDNQQAIVCCLLIAKQLRELNLTPDLSLGLIFVSDEETSSHYGMHYVMKKRPDLFGADDFVVIPDYGVADGSFIEISEKGQLWLRVEVTGKEAHGSRPHEGRNALVAASDMILHVRDLESLYAETDPIFEPPCCTFVPTRHEENVLNINSLPGRDVFYVDCRLLPGVDHDAVLASAREIMEAVAERHSVKVDVSAVVNAPASPATSPDSEVVRRLSGGIREIYGIEPRCVGSGGGTVAVSFRDMGIPAAAWSTATPTYHLANEFSLISRTLGDAQVLARMLFD
ncbi:M20 family metallo-hydrolase [uncultured Bilophila sp.]|nr:M20 family metallo-hydrolase [uncultured Bilophila sp.]